MPTSSKLVCAGSCTDLPVTLSSHCFACKEVGVLICCDCCPLAFHPHCVGLKAVPEGCWSCGYPGCAHDFAPEKLLIQALRQKVDDEQQTKLNARLDQTQMDQDIVDDQLVCLC